MGLWGAIPFVALENYKEMRNSSSQYTTALRRRIRDCNLGSGMSWTIQNVYRERNISRTHVLFSLVSASACISRPRGRLRIIMLLPGITAAHKENLVAGFSSTGLQRTSSCQLPSNI
jgi:hypothetical protein